jgi:hypothetical protein
MLSGARSQGASLDLDSQRRKRMSEAESRNIAVLVWIGTIFFGFVPSLIVYLIKKDDAYVLDQSKEALNWSITVIIGWFIGIITTFILIGFLVFAVVVICQLVFCIMGAVAASAGKPYRVPFALRLIN